MWIVLTHPRVMWFKRAELIITYGYKTFFFFFKSLKKKGKKKKKKKGDHFGPHVFLSVKKGPNARQGVPFPVCSFGEGGAFHIILFTFINIEAFHFTPTL